MGDIGTHRRKVTYIPADEPGKITEQPPQPVPDEQPAEAPEKEKVPA